MIAKTFSHSDLIAAGSAWLRQNYECNPVIEDLQHKYQVERADVLGFRSASDTYLIECKTSVSDFKADAAKQARKQALAMGVTRWFLCEAFLIESFQVPEMWGLLYLTSEGIHEVVAPTPHKYWQVNRTDEAAILLHYTRQLTRSESKPGKARASSGLHGKDLARVQDYLAECGDSPARDLRRALNLTSFKTPTALAGALTAAGFPFVDDGGVRIFRHKD